MYQLTIDDALMLMLYNDNILILTHRRPDGDTLGSAAGLCHALRARGKTAYVLENEETTPRYKELCCDLVQPEGFKPNFIISVDIADAQLLPENAFPYAGDIDLSIDHHQSNKGYAGHTYVVPEAAATGELIYQIIERMGVTFTLPMLTAIYVAVATDTGCFKYASTTQLSHKIAAAAMELGVDYAGINQRLFDSKSKVKFNVERHLYDNLRFYQQDKIVVGQIDRSFIDSVQANGDDLDNLSALVKSIEGVECAIIATQQKNLDYKISARTGDSIDASELCKLVCGGGHSRAAGGSVKELQIAEKLALMVEQAAGILNV